MKLSTQKSTSIHPDAADAANAQGTCLLPVSGQAGTALVLVTGLLIVIMGMLSVASARLASLSKLTKIDFAEQQAAAAAESVMSFRETGLVEIAAKNQLEKLIQNPDVDKGTKANVPFEGIKWFGDCLVRWRIEPVRVATSDGTRVISNPFIYPMSGSLAGDTDFMNKNLDNNEYYHYRIVSEAHYLADRNLIKDGNSIVNLKAAGALPWQAGNAAKSLAVVRATRIVQMKLNSLFKYALFYAQEGPYGDIEMGPGSDMTVAGRVHTNGSLYYGSGSARKWEVSGSMDVGTSADMVDMVAIGGIYLMRKDTLIDFRRGQGKNQASGDLLKVDKTDPVWGDRVYYGDGNQDPGPNEPGYVVPVDHIISLSGSKYKLNGKTITREADSRSGEKMKKKHLSYLRDRVNSGATVVKTMSNIPELGGRPFEDQVLFPEGTPIWTTNPSNPSDISAWTILPNDRYRPADYYTDPTVDVTHFSSSADTGANPQTVLVVDEAKRLYYTQDPRSFKAFSNTQSYTDLANNLRPGDVTVDADDDGTLDGTTVTVEEAKTWFVDAGGLRQYYQRTNMGNSKYTVDGVAIAGNNERNVDICDTYALDPFNPTIPSPVGVTAALGSGMTRSQLTDPAYAGFRYNGNYAVGAGNGDSNGDSFGDNEVPGTYLNWAMNGKDDPENKDLRGLVIRERKYQKLPAADSEDAWAGWPYRPKYQAVPATTAYEAEYGGMGGLINPVVESASSAGGHTGYNGIGYVNLAAITSSLSFTVSAVVGGPTKVIWRFANGSGVGREVRIDIFDVSHNLINTNNYTFPTTGTWDDWKEEAADLTLVAGSNEVRITTIGNDCANIDSLTVINAPSTIAYAKYLKSQYVVYFGNIDVTEAFFDYEAKTATSFDDMVAKECEVLDRRAGSFIQYEFWDQDTANSPNFKTNLYKVSMLNLNVRKCLDFLMNTDYGFIATGTPSTKMLKDSFSGLIYAHRTRRSNDYTPWSAPLWSPKCYLLWKKTAYANYELPPAYLPAASKYPWKVKETSVYPATAAETHVDTDLKPGFDWRTGSGPAMTFHSSFRLVNASDLNYGAIATSDMGTPDDTSDDYSYRKGLTFVSPNAIYVQGNFNIMRYPDSLHPAGVNDESVAINDASHWGDTTGNKAHLKSIPTAIFADFVTVLSNQWKDANQNYDVEAQPITGDCYLNVSAILNTVPSHIDGAGYPHTSGGAHNIMRYLEAWTSSHTHHISGSLVVMNIRRYSYGDLGSDRLPINKQLTLYRPPDRDFRMNSDLFTKPGQPPFSPYGVTVMRTVSTVDKVR